MTIYIAKADGWFKPGTAVELVADCDGAGAIFCGLRISAGPPGERRPAGEEYMDEELCPWDEVMEKS